MCNVLLMIRDKNPFDMVLAKMDGTLRSRIRSAHRPHLKANSTRPAFLFTNNENVKLTARPAIDTSASRDSLSFQSWKTFPSACFSPIYPLPSFAVSFCPCPLVFAVSHSPRQLYCFLSCSFFVGFSLSFPSFHTVHRNALGVRCTFIALLSQVCVLFFR